MFYLPNLNKGMLRHTFIFFAFFTTAVFPAPRISQPKNKLPAPAEVCVLRDEKHTHRPRPSFAQLIPAAHGITDWRTAVLLQSPLDDTQARFRPVIRHSGRDLRQAFHGFPGRRIRALLRISFLKCPQFRDNLLKFRSVEEESVQKLELHSCQHGQS